MVRELLVYISFHNTYIKSQINYPKIRKAQILYELINPRSHYCFLVNFCITEKILLFNYSK